MASTGTIIAAVVIIIVIAVGAALGLSFFMSGNGNNATSSSSSSSSSTTSSQTTTTSTQNTTTITSYSTLTSSTVLSSSNTTNHYALQLMQSGSGPVLSSPLSTTVARTNFGADGLGGDCGNATCFTYNYIDNANSWQVQGDFEPGSAYLFGNSTGFTMMDQTCSEHGNPLQTCGPYWEWNGDKRDRGGVITGEENVSELSAALYGVPSNAQVFSINVDLPNYTSIFANCAFNVSSTGCSYEGYAPGITGVWALDVGSNSIAVSLTESTHGMSASISTAAFINGQYQPNLSKNLPVNVPFFSTYTPLHKFTIATDRHSFIKVWIDNTLEYSNSTLPFDMSSNALSVNFYQFDNVNNETLGTTWSNFTAYGSPTITVSGLSNGMTVVANSTNGTVQTATANSSGMAVVDVSANPTNLVVSVESNGKVIDTYSTELNAGAQLQLVTTTSTTVVSSTSATTYTSTYVTTETK